MEARAVRRGDRSTLLGSASAVGFLSGIALAIGLVACGGGGGGGDGPPSPMMMIDPDCRVGEGYGEGTRCAFSSGGSRLIFEVRDGGQACIGNVCSGNANTFTARGLSASRGLGVDGITVWSIDTLPSTPPQVTVFFGADRYTVNEGATVTVTVRLSRAPGRLVTVPIMVTLQGGASAADYGGVPASVTFGATETRRTFAVSAQDDDLANENNESLDLSFGTLPAGVTAGNPATATVTLVDTDGPSVTVFFGADRYTVNEGATVTVTVSLSEAPGRRVTVPIMATPRGGASAADYGGVPASVTFAATETSRTFAVSARDDLADDDNESLDLDFGIPPAGVMVGNPHRARVLLVDNDGPVTVFFGSESYTAIEGGRAPLVVVRLSRLVPGQIVEVPISVEHFGGASSADYSGVPTSVSFASSTLDSFAVTATDDTEDDDNAFIQLTLGTPSAGAVLGEPNRTTVHLEDNDGPVFPMPSISFGEAGYTVTEGETVTVTVSLSEASGRIRTVAIQATPLGGAAIADYTVLPTLLLLMFGPEQTSQSFTVTATDDSQDDDGESVRFGFFSLPAGISAGTPATSTVRLVDNDVPNAVISFGAAEYTAREGGAAATVTIRLTPLPSGPLERQVIVPIDVILRGGASAADYSGVPDSVTFEATETSKTFTVTAVDDDENDDNESIRLEPGSPLPDRVFRGSFNAITVVNLQDND